MKNDLKYTRSGSIEVTLVVPYEYADLANDLRHSFGLPLSVDVQKWKIVDETPAL